MVPACTTRCVYHWVKIGTNGSPYHWSIFTTTSACCSVGFQRYISFSFYLSLSVYISVFLTGILLSISRSYRYISFYLYQLCTKTTCPVMSAGPNFQYLWPTPTGPVKLSAHDYIDNLFIWIDEQIDDPALFPFEDDQDFPKVFSFFISRWSCRRYSPRPSVRPPGLPAPSLNTRSRTTYV
jgi:hypothetical protein